MMRVVGSTIRSGSDPTADWCPLPADAMRGESTPPGSRSET